MHEGKDSEVKICHWFVTAVLAKEAHVTSLVMK